MKSIAERLNSLYIDHQVRTSECIFHGVNVEDIPVKSFHTLFSPIYVLDDRLQNSGGSGPPKWEPRSYIGVYLGHSHFHSGSVALVWNPIICCINPQYHLVFDNEFSTVPYMEAGTIPSNWEHLVKYSPKMATAQDVNLADTWLRVQSNEEASDPLSDPFAIVTDRHKHQKTNTSGSASANKDIPVSVSEGDKSHEASSPTSQPMNQTLQISWY